MQAQSGLFGCIGVQNEACWVFGEAYRMFGEAFRADVRIAAEAFSVQMESVRRRLRRRLYPRVAELLR